MQNHTTRENFRYEDHPGSGSLGEAQEQDQDGGSGGSISSGRTFTASNDAAFQRACFRSCNFWLHEFCSYNPKRFIGLPLLSI
jgi:hypothetical protein